MDKTRLENIGKNVFKRLVTTLEDLTEVDAIEHILWYIISGESLWDDQKLRENINKFKQALND